MIHFADFETEYSSGKMVILEPRHGSRVNKNWKKQKDGDGRMGRGELLSKVFFLP